MDLSKQQFNEVSNETKTLNTEIIAAHSNIRETSRQLHKRLTAMKEKWIAQGEHSKDDDVECSALVRGQGQWIRANVALQEEFLSDQHRFEKTLTGIKRKDFEEKFVEICSLRNRMRQYIDESLTVENQNLLRAEEGMVELDNVKKSSSNRLRQALFRESLLPRPAGAKRRDGQADGPAKIKIVEIKG